jgi:hypothetical protein
VAVRPQCAGVHRLAAHAPRRRAACAGTGLTPYRGTAASLRIMAGLTIGKLAAGEGVGVETVRFYQRRGLLALPDRAGSGFREYTEDDRLAFSTSTRTPGRHSATASCTCRPWTCSAAARWSSR